MPYIDDDQPPDTGFRGARPGVSAADLSGDAAAGGWADDPGLYDAWVDDTPRWTMDDGAVLTLPGWAWGRLGGRPRLRHGLGGMLRGARRVGTVRQGWPVYRGHSAGRGWRVVGRPRGGRSRELEIVGLEMENGGMEMESGGMGESETFPIGSGPWSAPAFVRPAPHQAMRGRQLSRRVGWRLRLPHGALHRILGQLPPSEVRRLSGARHGADPAPALVRAVGQLARRARPSGRLSGGFTVFATPGWRLLVRPLGELQGEIVAVRPVQGELEMEEEAGRRKRPGGAPRKPRPPRPPRPPSGSGSTSGSSSASPSAGAAIPPTTPGAPETGAEKAVEVTYTWQPGCTLDQVCPDHKTSFYVLHDAAGKAVYGGFTTGFRRRMRDYRGYCRVFGGNPASFRVKVATAKGLDNDRLERYVIRSILKLVGAVNNVDKIEEHKLSSRQVVVTHRGKAGDIPDFLKIDRDRKDSKGKVISHRWDSRAGIAVTTVAPGALFELPTLYA